MDLGADLHSLASAKQEVEHKKKKVESLLADLQSRFNESERQKGEMGDRVFKISVSVQFYSFSLFFCLLIKRVLSLFI